MTDIVFYHVNNKTILESNFYLHLNRMEMAVSLLGIGLNLTMLVYIAMFDSLRRLPGTKCVTSVSLASLLSLFINLVYTIIVEIHTLRIPAFCVTMEFLFAFFTIAAIYSRVLTAFDRYMYIRNALLYNTVVTSGKTLCLLALLWTFSLCLAGVSSLAHSRSLQRTSCEYPHLNSAFEVIAILAMYGLPCLWLFMIYGTIFYQAYYQIRELHYRESYMRSLRKESSRTSNDYTYQEEFQLKDELYNRLPVGSADYRYPNRKLDKATTSTSSSDEDSFLRRLSLKTRSSLKYIRNVRLSLSKSKIPVLTCFDIQDQDFTYNASPENLESEVRRGAEKRGEGYPGFSQFHQRLKMKSYFCDRNQMGSAANQMKEPWTEDWDKNNSTKADDKITTAKGENESFPASRDLYGGLPTRSRPKSKGRQTTGSVAMLSRRRRLIKSGGVHGKKHLMLADPPSLCYASRHTGSLKKRRLLNGVHEYNSRPFAGHLSTSAAGSGAAILKSPRPSDGTSVDPNSYHAGKSVIISHVTKNITDDDFDDLDLALDECAPDKLDKDVDDAGSGCAGGCCGCFKVGQTSVAGADSNAQVLKLGQIPSVLGLAAPESSFLTKSSILTTALTEISLLSNLPRTGRLGTSSSSEILSRGQLEKTVTFDAKRETVTFIDSRISVQPDNSISQESRMPVSRLNRFTKAYVQTFAGRLSKLILVIALIITCNILLWIPYLALHLTRLLRGLNFNSFHVRLSHCLALVTCVMDPLIFGFMNIAFRQILIQKCRSLFCMNLSRSSSLQSRSGSAQERNPKRSFRLPPVVNREKIQKRSFRLPPVNREKIQKRSFRLPPVVNREKIQKRSFRLPPVNREKIQKRSFRLPPVVNREKIQKRSFRLPPANRERIPKQSPRLLPTNCERIPKRSFRLLPANCERIPKRSFRLPPANQGRMQKRSFCLLPDNHDRNPKRSFRLSPTNEEKSCIQVQRTVPTPKTHLDPCRMPFSTV